MVVNSLLHFLLYGIRVSKGCLQFSYWQITQGQASFVPMSEHKKNLSMPDKDYFKVT